MQATDICEKLLKEIITHSFDEIIIADGSGNVLAVSPSCQDLYGVSAESMIGQNVRQLEKMGVLNPSVTALVLKSGQAETMIQQTRTGRKIIVSAYPLYAEDGRLVRVFSFSRDITELENLKARNEQVAKTLASYKQEVEELKRSNPFFFQNQKMKELMEIIYKVADLDVTVLLEGESGVGKNRIAQVLHEQSKRRQEPFVEVNTGAIPESLIESELFGYEEGSFTGAKKGGKPGLFEMAGAGTLFLDEISELPLHLQVKLLSVLQNRKVTRIGGRKAYELKCRIVCATNRELEQLIREKRFREDLYYRINVVKVHIPPLRERRDEIPSLIYEFTKEYNLKYQLSKQFSPRVIAWMCEQEWLGNIRELRNYIEKTMITSNSDYIDHVAELSRSDHGEDKRDQVSLTEYLESVEAEFIRRMYKKYPNSIALGRALGISQSTANRKINKYIRKSEISQK